MPLVVGVVVTLVVGLIFGFNIGGRIGAFFGVLLGVPVGITASKLVGVVSSSGSSKAVGTLDGVDNAIGAGEHAFVALALFSLIAVGTYQFIASRLFGTNDTWPFETLRYLVFFCAMGGASLSAQKGRMISMDFLSRKLAPKKRVILRILVAGFVIFACVLLYKGGMYVRSTTGDEEYELIPPAIALMALPVGAFLIAFHYLLHAVSDALYLSAGLIPPEEDGPVAH